VRHRAPVLNDFTSTSDTSWVEIVERREHEGVWWARDPTGSWYRWDADTNGWDGPVTPPWPGEPVPHPDEAAIVAAAMAAGARTARALGESPPEAPSDAEPMNRVDRWWNRRFPPFSRRRLVFGLIALPVIAALTELLWAAAGRGFSLPRYLFVCIAGGIFLSIVFLPGMREMAQRLQANGALRPAWPWSKRTEPPPQAPPLPPLRETFRREFVIGLPFAAAILLVMSLTVGGPADTSSPAGLATIAFGTAATSALIAMRRTVWGLIVFSLAGGFLGGFAMVLLSLMTWSDPGLAEFLIGWGLGSAMLFLFAYPMWRRTRDLEARGLRLPMWLLMGGSLLLVTGSALVFLAER
jgi:hypothetical protein